MYFIIINPEDKTNPINELVNDIVDAKNRGVQVSDNTISLALLELEDKGLIEVTRDKPARKYLAGKPTPPDFADRKANIYRILPLPRQSHLSANVYPLIFMAGFVAESSGFNKDNLLTTSQAIA